MFGASASLMLYHKPHFQQHLGSNWFLKRSWTTFVVHNFRLKRTASAVTWQHSAIHLLNRGGCSGSFSCCERLDGGKLVELPSGKLYKAEAGTVAGLRPAHFITLATPHLGCNGWGPNQVGIRLQCLCCRSMNGVWGGFINSGLGTGAWQLLQCLGMTMSLTSLCAHAISMSQCIAVLDKLQLKPSEEHEVLRGQARHCVSASSEHCAWMIRNHLQSEGTLHVLQNSSAGNETEWVLFALHSHTGQTVGSDSPSTE